MTAGDIAALFGTLFVLAFLPTTSGMAVIARSAAFGLSHGISVSCGIVIGDITFILIAIFGLSQLAGFMDSQFVLIKYLGGAYLIWLGLTLWRAKTGAEGTGDTTDSSLLSSFLAGLLITLADQKAILFYLGLFPAFLDLTAISLLDTGTILVVAGIAVGVPKCVYAIMAHRASRFLNNSGALKGINLIAGGIMICVGIVLFVRN